MPKATGDGSAIAEGPDLMTRDLLSRVDSVPGWFGPLDRRLFARLLEWQAAGSIAGDLVELGAYAGKSAIVLGAYLREDEELVVCDLFDLPAADPGNRTENERWYPQATQEKFEHHYRRFHGKLPRIVRSSTGELMGHLTSGSCRFIHIDASHLFHQVAADIEMTRKLMGPDGIVAIDDMNNVHSPGVSAAAWDAVLHRELQPVCTSGQKLYATWSDPRAAREIVAAWAADDADCIVFGEQEVGGKPVLVLGDGRVRKRPRPWSR